MGGDRFLPYVRSYALVVYDVCAFRRARSAKTTRAGRKIRLIDSRIIDVLPVRRVFSNVSSVSTSYVEIETPYRFLTGSAAIQRFEFYFGFVFKRHSPRPAITFQFLIPAPTRSLGDRVVTTKIRTTRRPQVRFFVETRRDFPCHRIEVEFHGNRAKQSFRTRFYTNIHGFVNRFFFSIQRYNYELVT